jgi:hypothetical protein
MHDEVDPVLSIADLVGQIVSPESAVALDPFERASNCRRRLPGQAEGAVIIRPHQRADAERQLERVLHFRSDAFKEVVVRIVGNHLCHVKRFVRFQSD